MFVIFNELKYKKTICFGTTLSLKANLYTIPYNKQNYFQKIINSTETQSNNIYALNFVSFSRVNLNNIKNQKSKTTANFINGIF